MCPSVLVRARSLPRAGPVNEGNSSLCVEAVWVFRALDKAVATELCAGHQLMSLPCNALLSE